MIISGVKLTNCGIIKDSFIPGGTQLLYLDAGNPASYPGTGNIWYDLSFGSPRLSGPYNVQAAAFNSYANLGAAYKSANGGYFDFSGGGAGTLNTGVYSNYTYTGKSVFVAVNCTSIATNTFECVVGNRTGAPRNFNFYLYNNAGQLCLHFSTNGGGTISKAFNYVVGTWATFGVAMDTLGNTNYYWNGQKFDTQTGGTFGQYGNSEPEYIGRGDNYWNGGIATVCVWGRQLTDEDMMLCHNTVRSRYGI